MWVEKSKVDGFEPFFRLMNCNFLLIIAVLFIFTYKILKLQKIVIFCPHLLTTVIIY